MSKDGYPALRDQRLHKHEHGEGKGYELEGQVHEHSRRCRECLLAVPVAVCDERSNCGPRRCFVFSTGRQAFLLGFGG
jgi:hypothetical protein